MAEKRFGLETLAPLEHPFMAILFSRVGMVRLRLSFAFSEAQSSLTMTKHRRHADTYRPPSHIVTAHPLIHPDNFDKAIRHQKYRR